MALNPSLNKKRKWNMELIIDEDGQKCAELFFTKYGKYIFLCVHCNQKFQSFDAVQLHCLVHIKQISGLAIEEECYDTEDAYLSSFKSENISRRQFEEDFPQNKDDFEEEDQDGVNIKFISGLAIEKTCYDTEDDGGNSIKSENIGRQSEENFLENKDDIEGGDQDGVNIEIIWCDENKNGYSKKREIRPTCKLSYKQHDQDIRALIENENLSFESFTEPQIQSIEGDDKYIKTKNSRQISNSSHSSSNMLNFKRKHRLPSSPNSNENYRCQNNTVEEFKNDSDHNLKLNATTRRLNDTNESIKSELGESSNSTDFNVKGRNRIHCSHCNYDFLPIQHHDQNKCAKIQKVILSCNGDYDILSTQGIHLCKECPRYFDTNRKLSFHRAAHYNSGICQICNKKFICLKKHFKSQHIGVDFVSTKNLHSVKSYDCRYCEQKFVKEQYWKKHENIHENESLKCKTCGKIFKSKMYLINHVRTHTGERPYACKLCPSAFAIKRNLDSHHIYKHTDEKNFECRHEGGCGKTFKTDSLRNIHERRHTDGALEKCFQCELCGISFTTKYRLQMHNKIRHMDYNDRKNKCEFCEKKFLKRSRLVEHIRTHTGEKPIKCDICSSSFARRSSLREHKKLHNPEKQHVCQLCGRSFAQIAGYYNHMKNHP